MTRFTAIGFLAVWALASYLSPVVQSAQWAMVNGHWAHSHQLLAKLKKDDPASRKQVKQLLRQKGLAMISEYSLVPGLCVLSTPVVAQGLGPRHGGNNLGGLVQELEASGLFDYVEPDYVWEVYRSPSDAAFESGILWGLRNTGSFDIDIEAEAAWDITTGSRDVIVGVLDTGVRYSHQDLENQMWENPEEVPGNGEDDDGNGYVDDIFGINAIVDSGDPLDDDGHGSHVAGILGASANDSGDMVGVAWDLRIMGLKVLGTNGGTTSDVIQGFEYGIEHGCRIINASLGGGAFSQGFFDVIAEGQRRGVLLVASAGNENSNNDIFPSYPANYNLDNVISVAAMDRFGEITEFSNFGLHTVDIAAPGEDIFSLDIENDSAYQARDGTSMAAPHVSGVAALVLGAFPEATVHEVRERILSSAIEEPAFFGKVATGGRVSALGALSVTGDGALEMTVDPPHQSALQRGSTASVVVRISDVFGVTDAVVIGELLHNGETITFDNTGTVPDVQADDALYTYELMVPEDIDEIQLTVRAEAPNKQSVESVVRYLVVDPPINDNFESSVKLPAEGISLVTDTRFASFEIDEPFHAEVDDVDYSLWWIWTPQMDTEAFVGTSGSNYDTVIGVYTGNALTELTEVASVNDVGTRPEGYLTFSALAGTTYRIAVAGAAEGEFGTLRFRLTPGGAPDLIAPIVAVTAPTSGILTDENRLVLEGTAFDPKPNSSGVGFVFLRANDEPIGRIANGTTRWTSPVPLVPGQNTIQVTATDFSGNTSEARTIGVIYLMPEPPNDHFAEAEVLSGDTGVVNAINQLATKQFGEPLHAGNRGGASVWYSYTPAVDGVLSLQIRRASFDTVMAVYTGTRVAELQHIASNDDAMPGRGESSITQAVRSGVKYSIAVDGFAGLVGQADLQYEFTASAVFTLSVESGPGGSVSPESTVMVGMGEELTLMAEPFANFRFVKWKGSVTSTDNPLILVIDKDISLEAVFESTVFDGFESGDLTSGDYGSGGNQPWGVAKGFASTGDFSAKAGDIGDNENSSLFLNAVLAGGSGSFDFQVSSEERWDFLEFLINDELIQRWSGEITWQSFEFVVPAGNVRLEWRYSKDFTNTVGDDTAYIDNLRLPFDGPRLLVNPIRGGGVELWINGTPGQTYNIEWSRDLIDWTLFAVETTDAGGEIRIFDSEFDCTEQCYFRAVIR
ncbi:MAG: Thermophilic serine proteinase [Verrucomicrobia subdivision 3 bacterium]|nr:Thermophilic serine proteinase [Limisphaerales bacterium]MCS1413835.1 Thermophilic serine proteinase [Limisphaerales bacterium]